MNEAATAFHEEFGYAPTGVWSAPGRVNLIGEHVDYNAGLVLPIALPQRTFVACSTHSAATLRVDSRQVGQTIEVGLDIAVDSDVPVGAGLSSSAALECAVGAAISDVFDLALLEDDPSRQRLAAACARAENEVVGAPTGGMDQAASLLCREGRALPSPPPGAHPPQTTCRPCA